MNGKGGETSNLSEAERNLLKNSQWANLGNGEYQTPLSPAEKMLFGNWRIINNTPYDPSPTSDYDMAGFWRALMTGDPKASTGMNANDGKMHYTDYFKTPYHESFSRESKYAKPNAPVWNDLDQLVDALGNVVFDERKRK